MVVGVEGVEVEASSLLDVGWVGVDEDVGGVGFHGGEEVEAVELGDVDAVAEGSYVLDSFDKGRFVVAGVDLPLAGLVEAADGAGVEDAGSVGTIKVESGETEGEVVCLTSLVDTDTVGTIMLTAYEDINTQLEAYYEIGRASCRERV